MVKVTWTARARKDLDDISAYIAESSPFYAQQTEWAILEHSLILEQQPLMGHPVAEMRDTAIREISHGNYRIIYWVKSQAELVIIAVVHGKRQITRSVIRQRRKSR
ncbi:MAG: type II toxin-antitoxin system RelE/ParE family toxin [Bacteroidetes bacterium]|nr:type II toxin-antitoxin system RelE/ParE family toxin [Bacteroidota bacterium]